jgi:DNA-directed RNA polymerase subunit RPC12/RpoP
MTMKILTTCTNSYEASLIKGLLENNEIHCFLTNENFSNLMPHYHGIMGSGVQILIDENDFEAAKRLISSHETKDLITCPNCHSSNIKFGFGVKKIKKVLLVILSLLVWTPFGNINSNYYCQDCKTEFKSK